MRNLLIILSLLMNVTESAQKETNVVTTDISNFWKAYDQVVATKDSLQQISLIQTQYIDKGTDGLKGIMQARNYTAEDYENAINKHPLFWSSVRKNTLRSDEYAVNIEQGIKMLKKIYPDLRPAKIYFTIGAFRTNGTTIGDKVLIGKPSKMS